MRMRAFLPWKAIIWAAWFGSMPVEFHRPDADASASGDRQSDSTKERELQLVHIVAFPYYVHQLDFSYKVRVLPWPILAILTR